MQIDLKMKEDDIERLLKAPWQPVCIHASQEPWR